MTKNDLIVRALRRIGVVAHDEPATADQLSNCAAILDAMVAEVTLDRPVSWTTDDVPTYVAGPLWRLLAVEIAPEFGVSAPEPYKTALIRFQAMIAPDDRPRNAEATWY